MSPDALIVTVCASGVAGALLLLASLLGIVGGWAPPPCLGHLGCRHCCCSRWRRKDGEVSWGHGYLSASRVLGFMGTVAACWGGSTRVVGSASAAAQSPGYKCTCTWEARALSTDSPAAAEFSGFAGSAAVAEGQGHGCYLCCFPGLTASMCSSPPIFRYADVWMSLVAWCVGQRNLCWVTDVSLVVD